MHGKILTAVAAILASRVNQINVSLKKGYPVSFLPSSPSAIIADLRDALRKILLDVPFPESEHEPSELRQLVIDILVTLHISCKMALPVFLAAPPDVPDGRVHARNHHQRKSQSSAASARCPACRAASSSSSDTAARDATMPSSAAPPASCPSNGYGSSHGGAAPLSRRP